MPTITRRQFLRHVQNESTDTTSDDLPGHDDQQTSLTDVNADELDDVELLAQEGMSWETLPIIPQRLIAAEDESEVPFPPPGLKEISSLASWTVSTAKPGNGVAALRSSDMAQFWQSDGPQPHFLTIHFFKLVPIVLIRIFLDFEHDESYTPTKIQFLAGMGAHDLQDFAEMEFEQPTGWMDVDFSNVGPVLEEGDGSLDGIDGVDWSTRPVLRAMILQVKILENHQNGKDTHLRGVQIFARDEGQQQVRRQSNVMPKTLPLRSGPEAAQRPMHKNNLKLASWMQEPDLR